MLAESPSGGFARPSGGLGRRIASGLGEITLEKVSEVGFANAQKNAELITQGKSILALRDTALMGGTDAVVIAAGPSLHRQPNAAKLLKDTGYRGVIVATESSMSWLLRNGTVPDLVVTLDPHHTRIVRWFGDPELTEESSRQDDYYARQDMDPKFRENQLRFNRELLELIDRHGKQMKIAISSSASPAVVRRALESGMDIYWWNPMYDDYERPGSLTARIHALNGLPCVNAGGNVGSACWVFAHAVLEKKRVALVGVDFGYYGDTPYTQTQYYKEIVSLVGTEALDDVYVRIMNPHVGREFYTDPAYLWYRDAFLEMAGEAGCETYNCTGGGILFGANIHWSSLTEFVANARSRA
jgi:hypothetical protein